MVPDKEFHQQKFIFRKWQAKYPLIFEVTKPTKRPVRRFLKYGFRYLSQLFAMLMSLHTIGTMPSALHGLETSASPWFLNP